MGDNPGLARDVLALVLAGGSGTRLGALTRTHCKPALSFAGQYRNIDFTLSNCLNSGLRRIAVLTQHQAQSLLDHLAGCWNVLPRRLGEFIDVWPAQQRHGRGWYAGTADAVYQNLDLIQSFAPKYVLVLAGDHVYAMDYRPLLERAVQSRAEVTVACVPVPAAQAGGFGVVAIDERRRVTSFIEKPSAGVLGSREGEALASMGIYVFEARWLLERLAEDARSAASAHDFGRDILPRAVREGRVAAHPFTDELGRARYWRDVGTIEAYWQAHMELLADVPPLDLHDPAWPIHSAPEALPPARLRHGKLHRGLVTNSLLAGGVSVHGATVVKSVLAWRAQIGEGSLLEEVVVLPNARIGRNCQLRRTIVATDALVPDGTCIGPEPDETARRTGGACIALFTNATPETELRSVA